MLDVMKLYIGKVVELLRLAYKYLGELLGLIEKVKAAEAVAEALKPDENKDAEQK